MQGNSYRQINNSSSAELYKGRDLETFSQVQAPPVTAQPHFSRICNRMGNCDQTNSRSNVIGGKSLMNYAAAYGQNIKPWLRTPYHSDQNTRSGSSDSVIINFDNISEQSTSHPVDPYGFYVNKMYPERCEHTVPSIESSGLSDHLNLSDNIREINVDIPNHNRSYSSHEHNSSSSSSNNNNDNGNSNNDDNNDNISNESNNNNNNSTTVIQNNEGTHTESPSPGTQSLEKIINKYIPFITFVLLKAIYDHREGILIFVALLITFIHANYVVKREIAKQSRRSLMSLGIIFVNLFVSICFIYFVFRDQHLYKNLIFIPPYSQPISIWDVLWIVGITDFVLKFITIQLKVGMTCFPAKLLPYSARGKWYLMLERTSQLYRGLVPIQPWLYYLTEVYQGPDSIVGMFFSVAYVVSKGSDIKSKVKLFLKAFLKLLHSSSLGVRPSNEQLVSAGSQCPICHDEYNSPIILQCRHVFCESCVSTWFDREQTCPLCRAKIADDPSWRDGATSLFTQLF